MNEDIVVVKSSRTRTGLILCVTEVEDEKIALIIANNLTLSSPEFINVGTNNNSETKKDSNVF